MCGHALRDRIGNKDIQKGLKVTTFEKKMKENRLRWFDIYKDVVFMNQ